MVTLKKILVATDFSEPSTVALNYGRDLARSYGAQLHILHVVEDVTVRYATEIGLAMPEIQQELEERSRRDLMALITDDDRRTLSIEATVETRANIADGIITYARAKEIDLIVTGTHGRGSVKHFLMGSVAERVVRTAPCPVLTVREHERDFIGPDALTAVAAS